MSIASWVFRAGKKPGQRYSNKNSGELIGGQDASYSYNRTARLLLEAFEKQPWLRTVAGTVAQDFALTNWKMYRVPAGLKKSKLRIKNRSIEGVENLALGLEEVDHPLLMLLERPNAMQDGFEFLFVSMLHYDLTGMCLWGHHIVKGKPVAMYNIPPHNVVQWPTLDRPEYRIQVESGTVTLPSWQVTAIRNPRPVAPLTPGAGIGKSLVDELDADEQAAKHAAAYWRNRANPAMLVGIKNASQENVDLAKSKWEKENRSAHNAFRTHFYSGDISVMQLTQSMKDADFTNIREFERDVIRTAWGVPPERFGIIENSNRSTIDASDFLYSSRVLLPRLERFRIAILSALLPFWEGFNSERVLLSYENPVREDKDFQFKVAQAAPQAITVNEWRKLGGWPPLSTPEGEKPYVPIEYTSNVEGKDDDSGKISSDGSEENSRSGNDKD